MARKIVTDPKCDHARKGIVTTSPGRMPNAGEAHAATQVCDRDACIEDAVEWAALKTGLPARYVSDYGRTP